MDDAEREARRLERVEWATATLSRRDDVMEDLVNRAHDTVTWLAVRRQANSYLRHLATWQQGTWFDGIRPAMDGHQARLVQWTAESEAALAGTDPEAALDAESRLGVRLAIFGKGGAGKTVICSTLARLLGRRGRSVFVADLDVNPGLSYSIGLDGASISLPDDAVEQRAGAAYGWQLRHDLLPRDVVSRYTVPAPDGVMVTSLGKIGGEDKSDAKRTVVAVVEVLLGFGEPGWDVIADLEAGPTTPFERYHAFADHVVVVIGPAWRSAMTARRLLPMVGEGRTTTIVYNRFRDEPDHPGLAPELRIPFDPDVAEAERQGLSPLDACPDSPTIAAIRELAEMFVPSVPSIASASSAAVRTA
jgi:CO dehydrogenase nickel-insertion accessory protein CooC1